MKMPSGMIFIEQKKGTGASPKATDVVKVHYKGTLVDGKVFDSSYDRGEPAQFPLNGVIPCWTEGVQKMATGGKAKLVCPSAIAYAGAAAAGDPTRCDAGLRGRADRVSARRRAARRTRCSPARRRAEAVARRLSQRSSDRAEWPVSRARRAHLPVRRSQLRRRPEVGGASPRPRARRRDEAMGDERLRLPEQHPGGRDRAQRGDQPMHGPTSEKTTRWPRLPRASYAAPPASWMRPEARWWSYASRFPARSMTARGRCVRTGEAGGRGRRHLNNMATRTGK